MKETYEYVTEVLAQKQGAGRDEGLIMARMQKDSRRWHLTGAFEEEKDCI